MTEPPAVVADRARDPHLYTGPVDARWTTRNIGEAVPGVPTPLSWSLWGPATNGAVFGMFGRLGAWSPAELAKLRASGTLAVALFDGRPAANIDLFSTAAGRSGQDPAELERGYFSLEPGPATPSRSLARLPIVAVRAPRVAHRYRRHLSREAAVSEHDWIGVVGRPLDAGEAVQVLDAAARRFIAFMEAHTFQAALCSQAYAMLSKLAARPGQEELTTRLTGVDPELEEFKVAADLWGASRREISIEQFLHRHGFHGPEAGELAVASWREEPGPISVAIRSHAERSATRSPAAALDRRLADHEQAVRTLLAAHPARMRPGVRRVVQWAAREELRRELGKATFLRMLDVARHASRAIGASLVREGRLEEAGDVCLLTRRELLTLSRDADLDQLVSQRRALRALHEASDLPSLFTGEPVPIPLTGPPLPRAEPAAAIKGVGASPGVAEGRARVCRTAADCSEPLGPEEILVAHTTDPSWVAFFMTAGALVVDIGGPLSHAAIIARSLGVPCVIGCEDASPRIPDGARIRVDGSAGTVEFVDRPNRGG